MKVRKLEKGMIVCNPSSFFYPEQVYEVIMKDAEKRLVYMKGLEGVFDGDVSTVPYKDIKKWKKHTRKEIHLK